jgi:hypothetical protein
MTAMTMKKDFPAETSFLIIEGYRVGNIEEMTADDGNSSDKVSSHPHITRESSHSAPQRPDADRVTHLCVLFWGTTTT